jgi:hypothetical protein
LIEFHHAPPAPAHQALICLAPPRRTPPTLRRLPSSSPRPQRAPRAARRNRRGNGGVSSRRAARTCTLSPRARSISPSRSASDRAPSFPSSTSTRSTAGFRAGFRRSTSATSGPPRSRSARTAAFHPGTSPSTRRRQRGGRRCCPTRRSPGWWRPTRSAITTTGRRIFDFSETRVARASEWQAAGGLGVDDASWVGRAVRG